MGSITDIINKSKASIKPDKISFKQKFKESLIAGSKRVGRGISTGAKFSGRFAVKKGKEFLKEQKQFRKQKKTIVKQERLKAFRRDVKTSLAPKKQIQQKQIVQPKQVQSFPNLLGSGNQEFPNLLGNNKDKKPMKFF